MKKRTLSQSFFAALTLSFLGSTTFSMPSAASTWIRVEFKAGSLFHYPGGNNFSISDHGVIGIVEFSFTSDQINPLSSSGIYIKPKSERTYITPTYLDVHQFHGQNSSQKYTEQVQVIISGTESLLNISIGTVVPFNGVGFVRSGTDDWNISHWYTPGSFVPTTSYNQGVVGAAGTFGALCWYCDGKEMLTASYRVLPDGSPSPDTPPSPSAPPQPFSGPIQPPRIIPSGAGAIFGDVPEPSTWLMMLGGFAIAGGAIRHRKHSFKVSLA